MKAIHSLRTLVAALCAAATALTLAVAGAASASADDLVVREFDDDTSPQIFAGPDLPTIATHSSEIQYLFDQPNAPYATPLSPPQEALAAGMRTAWANFAANGDPTSAAVPWPSFNAGGGVLSLASPRPQVDTGFATTHHCSFWAAG